MPSKFLSFAATRTIWWQEHPGTSRVYILDEEDFSGKRSSRPKVCQRAFPCLHTRFADGFVLHVVNTLDKRHNVKGTQK